MRKRIADFAEALPVKAIDLGSSARLPGDYVAGHALGATYTLSALPDEVRLRADLQTIVRAYRSLTYRGGIDADIEASGGRIAHGRLLRGCSSLRAGDRLLQELID
jgi:5-methylcytosine-specific restriction enzyme A